MFLALLGVYRLSLIGVGAQSNPDELIYYAASHALYEGIFALDPKAFCGHVAEYSLRYVGTLFYLIPSALQAALHSITGYAHANPRSLVVGQVFTVATTLAVTRVVFELAKTLFGGDRLPALFVAVIYGLMASSNVYVRHLLPFDLALTFHLSALLLVVRTPTEEPLSTRTCVLSGLLLGLGHGAYPGYFLFPLSVFAIVGLRRVALRRKPFANAVIGSVAFSVLLAYELLAASVGVSYFLGSTRLSETITHGAFEEGFVFLPRYLVAVEGALGVLLMVLFLLYVGLLVAKRGRPTRYPALVRVAVVMAATFFVQASLSAVLHKIVLYGRLVHLYLPFLVIVATAALWQLPWPRARAAGRVLALAFALVGVVRFTIAYTSVAYPRDVVFDLQIQTLRLAKNQRINEFVPYTEPHSPPGVPLDAAVSPRLRLVNLSVMAELKGEPHQVPAGAKVLFRGLHFRVLPGYSFDGIPPKNRAILEKRRYEVVVYEIP